MKRSLKTLAGLVGGAMLSASASAYDSMYIFGDSLSDTGNAQAFLAPQGINLPARFSNGPVAVDIIAGAYGLSATPSLFLFGQEFGNNYAVGGAVALDADGDDNNVTDTNLSSQVNAYLAYNGFQSSPTALYAVIIGGNDLFAAQEIRAASVAEDDGAIRQDIRKAAEARVSAAVQSVEAQLMKLVGTGARNLLVASAPDVAAVPASLNASAGLKALADDDQEATRAGKFLKYTSLLTAQYNEELAAAVARVEALAGIDIIEWDLESYLNNQVEDAALNGYTNSTSGCIEDLSNLPACDGYVFFDTVHPTTAVHTTAGMEVIQLLQQ
jgi:phospholipase/lecithinase/hemolysin